jgi:hypothetical protein
MLLPERPDRTGVLRYGIEIKILFTRDDAVDPRLQGAQDHGIFWFEFTLALGTTDCQRQMDQLKTGRRTVIRRPAGPPGETEFQQNVAVRTAF